MKNSTQFYPEIKVDGEINIVDEIYISSLGYLMFKTLNNKTKTYHTYNLGSWEKVVNHHLKERTNKNFTFIKKK